MAAEVEPLVDALGTKLAGGDRVRACVVADAAASGDLREALVGAKSGAVDDLARVQAAASQCSVRVVGAPRFAEELQRQAKGELSAEQLDCAMRGYGELTPEVVSSASGALLNPEAKGAEQAVEPLRKVLVQCKIEQVGG